MAVGIGFAPPLRLGQFDADAVDAAGGEAVGIGAAAELAIGHNLEPDRLLLGDGGADRFVFDRAQFRGVDLAGVELGAGVHHRSGTNEAADLVGAERRMLNAGHRTQASSRGAVSTVSRDLCGEITEPSRPMRRYIAKVLDGSIVAHGVIRRVVDQVSK